jgi:hypothetical protein
MPVKIPLNEWNFTRQAMLGKWLKNKKKQNGSALFYYLKQAPITNLKSSQAKYADIEI